MARTLSRFTTSSGTWEKKVDSAGRTYYTGPSKYAGANGRVSVHQFRGAQSRNPPVEREFSINNPSKPGEIRFRPMSGVAQETRDGWIAGGDVQEIDPSLSPGEFITKSKAQQLRNARRNERAFSGFWEKVDPNMSRDEALRQYWEFIKAIRNLKLDESQERIREQFGIGGSP